MLGCNRYRLLPPVTGDVRGSVTRGTGDRGTRAAGVQPIQVAAARDRRHARQRDKGLRGRGLGVLGCVRFRLLTPVTGNVRSSETRG